MPRPGLARDSVMVTPWFANFGQISFGVNDLRTGVSFWERQLGVGPWNIFYGLTLDTLYCGRRISLPFDVAIGWHDNRLVELIQVKGAGPSPFHDASNRAIIGMLRMASITDGIERDCELAEQSGMERFAEGKAGDQRFVYFRSNDAPGVILELLERTAAFDIFVSQLRERAELYRRPPQDRVCDPQPKFIEPGSMKAALISGYGGPEVFFLRHVPLPSPGAGEVRIRVAGAAVNPVDIKLRKGMLHAWMSLDFPAQLGGDVSGLVDAIGKGVRRFAIGDRVAGMIDPSRNGAYAECVIVHETMLVTVPAHLDLASVAALPTGVLAGTQLVEIGIGPRVGDRVLVTGAGGSTGRAAIMAVINAGAIAIAGIRPSSRAAVADLPVERVVDLTNPAEIAALPLVDAVADTVGGTVAEGLFLAVKPDGIVASLAMPLIVPPAAATQRFCSVIVRFDGERLARFIQQMPGTGHAMPIARQFRLDEVASAHRLMEEGGVGGKIILVP